MTDFREGGIPKPKAWAKDASKALWDALSLRVVGSPLHKTGLVFRDLKLSYHNKETILCTIHPDYGNLK